MIWISHMQWILQTPVGLANLLTCSYFSYLKYIVMHCSFLIAAEMTYVNLQLNPERYTGYAGPSARRIWEATYRENCPKCESIMFC